MPRKNVVEAPITSETMAYLHCWRKAHETGEFPIPCADRTEAERTKFLLYRTAKQLYANPALAAEYPQFVRARQNCSVRCQLLDAPEAERLSVNAAEYPWIVLVYRSDRKREVRKLVDRLGLTEDDLRVPKAESELELERKVAGVAVPNAAGLVCEPERLPAGMAAYFEREES